MLEEALLFALAILPLLMILAGVLLFKQSGARMAMIGLIATVVLAIIFFKTPLNVAVAATIYGILKSLGITLAVVVTMLMIFVMRETGALAEISKFLNALTATKEEQALFVGIAFGSLVTSLGIVTPAMFPPLLVAMGFAPFAAVAIAVLGYNATTSYALLSLPVTIPSDLFGLDAFMFSLKISMFLPVISIGLSVALLWILGGWGSVRRGLVPAVIVGLAIAFTCLLASWSRLVPVQLIGVLAGLVGMASLLAYGRVRGWRVKRIEWTPLLKAASPWLILILLAAVVYLPEPYAYLRNLPGDAEVFTVYGRAVDLDVLVQIYTWIAVALVLSIPFLKPDAGHWAKSIKTWSTSIWAPSAAYSFCFAIAYVMAWSAMLVVGGRLDQSQFYATHNMNNAVGTMLAAIFGGGYIFVAVWLGLFGAVVGGSETGSNVLFYGIQRKASTDIALTDKQFLTLYAGHANAGGVASAVTPSKINNAVATIKGDPSLEAAVMEKHLVIVLILTMVTGVLNGIFVLLAF